MKDKRPDNLSPRIANRKAFHDYHIEEKFEVGIVLVGSEVKSIRHAQVSLAEGFAHVDPNTHELFLFNVDIQPYAHAALGLGTGHEAKRPRKLLAHRRQIKKLEVQQASKGATLVPLAMYFVRGRVKIELAIAQGKQAHDKRHAIKDRDADREIRRAMSKRMR